MIELIYAHCRKLGGLWNRWVGEVFMSSRPGVIEYHWDFFVIVVGLGSAAEPEERVGSVIDWGLQNCAACQVWLFVRMDALELFELF